MLRRHMMRGLAVVFLLSPVALAAPVFAQTAGCTTQDGQYPPSSGSLETSSSTVRPGESVTVSGCGFLAGSSVNIDFDGTRLATVTVGSNGGFVATVTIPESAVLGSHILRATGTTPEGGPRVLAATVQVVAGAAGDDLPRTGSSSTTPLVAAGIGMVLLGSAAVVAARRRRAVGADV